MEKDIELMFSLNQCDFVKREDLNVTLSECFNRVKMPHNYEDKISEIWAKRIFDNPKLWNGTKFRLHSIENKNKNVTFNIGITCYRDFIGTNWSPDIKELQAFGIKNHGNSHVYLSDALGVGALVITSDNKLILMRRSKHCGEAIGLLDIPGGHPEPKVELYVNYLDIYIYIQVSTPDKSDL